MTEAEWLSCTTQPAAMLRVVRRHARRRKRVLLGCGCSRLVWDHLDAAGRAAVEAAERDADTVEGTPPGPAAPVITEPPDFADPDAVAAAARTVVWAATHADLWNGLDRAAGWVVRFASLAAGDRPSQAALSPARARLCDVFREVVGNPFRPWQVAPAFLGGGLVQPDGRVVAVTDAARALAAAVYAERAFDRLPVLADAAEEAGVTDAALLAHLRAGGDHVRGCWAVDLLLGKG